jgi:serine/threonine protein kinase
MSERWQQVKKIFNAALERPVGERSRYLAQACAGDEDLRAEVESLLAADSQADNVLLIPIGPAPFMDTIVPTTLAPGTRFGPYEIERLLGAGGMGEVYKARDTRLDRTVAMKVLPSRFARDPELRKRLHREARAISSLNHPHIRALYDIGEQDGLEFLVMEYLEGETLADRLGAGPLPLTEAVRYAQEMIGALAEAHQHGIVHRDLKPRNVMLAKSGTKLLDFGIAKVRGELAEDTGEGAAGLTAKGSVLGTLQYMAPEQLEGHQVDVRTDIFAFGLVVYEMVTGRKAFEATTETSLIVAILERDPTPLRAVQPLAPLWLETLVARCLAKRPADRWQSSVELLAQLAQDGSEAAALASMGREPAAGMEESPTQGATGLTESRPATGELASIAVLAFTNMSADKEQEYFCDGIAEELINALTKLSGLRVASRTSAFQFKGRAVEVSEIGRRLKVDTILEGSVRKAGNRLRVTARLVDTRSGYELWSERFDREMDDVFAVQDEIARAVAEGLRMQLTDEPVIAPTTRSVDAYHLYLKGRDYWTRRYSGFLHTAVECFEQAIAIDPGYALAHAGLADGYAVLGFWGYLPSREMMAKAEAAARRALMLDSGAPVNGLRASLLRLGCGSG